MDATAVTSKGQVTIPKAVRQQLGIRQGSLIEFAVVGDRAELRLRPATATAPAQSGFGMLKSRRVGLPAVPADFDVATLMALR